MILRIAVCDDALADRERLISLIQKEYLSCQCQAYESGEALLMELEDGGSFDIFFLDIFMRGISGMETARRIRESCPSAPIIFVSSSDGFYRESYDLYAFNYLLKPLTAEKLSPVLYRVAEALDRDASQTVRFSFDNSLYTIPFSQLLYLVSEKHKVHFHLKSGETLQSYGKIDDFATQLPASIFFRCHQSYIVNLRQVTGMTPGEFQLGEMKIPISRKYAQEAREQYRLQMFDDF